jgi:hypothetical protein
MMIILPEVVAQVLSLWDERDPIPGYPNFFARRYTILDIAEQKRLSVNKVWEIIKEGRR